MIVENETDTSSSDEISSSRDISAAVGTSGIEIEDKMWGHVSMCSQAGDNDIICFVPRFTEC